MKKVSIKKISFVLIFHLFLCLIFSQIGLLFNFTISGVLYPFSIIISLFICKINVNTGITLVFILAITFLISGYFFDLSADGQTYHQETIIQLKQGWNPFLSESQSRTMKVWIDHYPKGAETIQSNIYALFGKIEIAKSINFFLFLASLLITKKAMEVFNLNSFKQWMYSFLVAANPVVISQILTFYVDGIGYSLLTCFFVSLFLFIKTKDRLYMLLFIASFTVGGSLKFTSIPILAVLGFFILVLLFIFNKKFINRGLIVSTIFLPFLLLLCNYNPYITNIKEGKHIFYPIKGDGAIDIIESFAPPGFVVHNNRIQKLAFTLFTKTGSFDKENITYKIPFTVNQKELNRLSDADIGVGGFGVFFGGFIIVLLLYYLYNYKKLFQINKKQKILLLSTIPIIISVLIIPDPWWVRYIPQFYLIPLILLLILEINNSKVRNLFLLKAILTVNISLLIVAVSVLNVYGTEKTYYILDMLKKSEKNVKIDSNGFSSNLNRLEEFGIPYEEIKIKNIDENTLRFQPKGSVILNENYETKNKGYVYKFLKKYFYKID